MSPILKKNKTKTKSPNNIPDNDVPVGFIVLEKLKKKKKLSLIRDVCMFKR